MTGPIEPRTRLLRIDLEARTATTEELEPSVARQYPGGALLAARLLLLETPADLDPFDPRSPLVVVGSVIAGREAPGLARCSFVARSPLTGALGEARVEGPFAVALGASGFVAIVVTGSADAPVAIVVRGGSAEIADARELWGSTTDDVVDLAQAPFGPGRVAAIGPAGERLVRFADIVTDRSFAAARTGVGAVMGAKRLKAIVLADDGFAGDHRDGRALAEVAARYADDASRNPLSRWQHDPPGFGTWVGGARAGTFAVENYRTSRSPRASELSPTAFLRSIAWSDGGCPGCPTDCIKGFAPARRPRDPVAARRAGGLHQEAVCALGPNVGLTDPDAVLDLNDRALRLGLDPVSLGFTIAFALECREAGLVAPGDLRRAAADIGFGDSAGIGALVDDIASRSGPGAWLADGSRRAADFVGGGALPRAMTTKGLELPVFEPRTSPGIALGYALNPTGPRYDFVEHDADFDDEAPAWPHALALASPLGLGGPFPMTSLGRDKVRAVGRLAELWSAFDALEVCIFAAAPTRPLGLDDVAVLVRAITGWDATADEVLEWGRRRLHLLRLYALREGHRMADDDLPARFFDEPIDVGPFAGTVLDRAAFADARASFYADRGWDVDGVPTPATLRTAGLDWADAGATAGPGTR